MSASYLSTYLIHLWTCTASLTSSSSWNSFEETNSPMLSGLYDYQSNMKNLQSIFLSTAVNVSEFALENPWSHEHNFSSWWLFFFLVGIHISSPMKFFRRELSGRENFTLYNIQTSSVWTEPWLIWRQSAISSIDIGPVPSSWRTFLKDLYPLVHNCSWHIKVFIMCTKS